MSEIWFQEFRDENAGSKYPFADDASLTAKDGLTLSRGLFVDATVYPIGGKVGLGITEIDVVSRQVTVWVGDPVSGNLASGVFDPLFPLGALILKDVYGRPAGMFVVDPGNASVAQTWPVGTHQFAAGAAALVASCTVPTPETGVRAFVAPTGLPLTGDAWLIGVDGVVLTDQGGAVRIDVVGDPLFLRRIGAPGGLFVTPRVITTVTVVDDLGHRYVITPDAAGNFNIVVGASVPDTVLRVAATPPDSVTIGAVGRAMGD